MILSKPDTSKIWCAVQQITFRMILACATLVSAATSPLLAQSQEASPRPDVGKPRQVPPAVFMAIPDTSVAENSLPIDNYRDLNDVFADAEDGDSLDFSIQSNSNPGLIVATIDADSALDLSFTRDRAGSATVVIRATDSGNEYAEETFVVTVHRTLWHVSADGSGQAPTIQAAINATVDGDTVLLSDGVYTGIGNNEITPNGKMILITSEHGPEVTIVDCQNAKRAFIIDNAEGPETVISGITVKNGNKHLGGGIKISGASPTIMNTIITQCSASRGAAIFCNGGAPTIKNNLIIGNSADQGAGIYCDGTSPIISGNTIVENSGSAGGAGIHLEGSASPRISYTIIAFNTQGPGVYCASGSANPRFTCSNIYGNDGEDAICGVNGGGNISADPLFCGSPGSGIATIDSNSPCAPANNSCGRLIGALPVACGAPNSAPVVLAAIPDTTLKEDDPPPDNYRDLNSIFNDAEDGGSLDFTIQSNSNPGLIQATIDADSSLDLALGLNQSGVATLVVRATDSGALFAEDTFVVTVTPVNDQPFVIATMPDTTLNEDDPRVNNYRDLNGVFNDIEDGGSLDFMIQSNSNPGLILAAIDADSALDLWIAPKQTGIADIIIRATDSGALFVDDTLTVAVAGAGGAVIISAVRVGSASVMPGAARTTMLQMLLRNNSAAPETLEAITFTNTASGPGTQAQLDADFSLCTLAAENGEAILPGGSTGPAAASVSAGKLVFSGLEVVIRRGETLTLIIEGGASLSARDGDVLDLALSDSTDVLLSPPIERIAAWPIAPVDQFPVNGMVAQQITLHAVPASTFGPGSKRNLALDAMLPANGYSADVLNRLNIRNLGTAVPMLDIDGLEAWRDDGDGIFSAAIDARLGLFSYTGSRWELTGLSAQVPLSGLRVFITVNINQTASGGRTVRLAIPTVPDLGIGMNSGNDGPLDAAVENPFAQSLLSSTSIGLLAVEHAAETVRPGDRGRLLLHLMATSNYPVQKQVTQLVIRNGTASQGPAGQSDLDREIDVVVLRMDGNDDGFLGDEATDPVIAATFFIGGRATFSGLTWTLPAGASRHLFVTGDASLMRARDEDILGAFISGVFDITFSDATTVVANWPLDSHAELIVDGMLAAQAANVDVPAVTLAPGDGPVLALDIVLPGNGYAGDVLNGLEVANLGTADSLDIADMRLWRDGGDGQFTPQSGLQSGDDMELSPLIFTGGRWRSPFLTESVPAGGARIFVGLTVSGSPADSASVRLAVPVNGIMFASNNDGPIDVAIESSQSLLLSTAPLLATVSADPAVSTVGQTVTVRMSVRNVGTERINTIIPSVLSLEGDALFGVIGGPQPAAFDLESGAADTFTWEFTAMNSGLMRWSGSGRGIGSVSGLPRRSLNATSNLHRVFDQAGDIELFPISTMPFQISRGQTDIIPLSLTFSVSGGAQSSNAQVQGLRIRLEDGQGNGIVPADLLSRTVVSEGNTIYATKTIFETSGAEVDMTFSTPAIVPPVDQATLAIRLDILPASVVPEFRVVISNAAWIAAQDAISHAPVNVSLQQGEYPIVTGIGRLVVMPSGPRVQSVSSASQRIGRGQAHVEALSLQIENPGVSGLTTDIGIGALAVSVTDSNGVILNNPARLFDRILVAGPEGVLSERILNAQDSTVILLPFSPVAQVPANTPVELSIFADVAEDAPAGACRFQLSDSSTMDARDSNTGTPLPVMYLTDPVAGGSLFIEATADSLFARGTPAFPPALTVGRSGVPAMAVTLRHPGIAGVGRIRADEITLRFQNEQRNPVVPGSFITRIRVLKGAEEIANIGAIPVSGDNVLISFSSLVLEPEEHSLLNIVVDFSATAPQSFLEIVIDETGIGGSDANIGTPVIVAADDGITFPLTSGLTQVLPPATRLVVSMNEHMPAVLAAGTIDLSVADISLVNTAASGSGAIIIDHFSFAAADRAFNAITLGSVVNRVALYADGTLIGESALLRQDSATAFVPLPSPLLLEPQAPMELELRLDLQSAVAASSVRLGLDARGVGVVQPSSALLRVSVESEPGMRFPLWTEAGNFSGLSIRGSFSNFPNPFGAGSGSTTFTYYLHANAAVTLKIRTARGEGVATLRQDTHRAAGVYQDDIWDGKNGRGVAVLNGVYIAELIVRYENGTSEHLLRKVAVVR